MIAGYNESAGSDNIKLQSAEVTDGVVHLVNDLRGSRRITQACTVRRFLRYGKGCLQCRIRSLTLRLTASKRKARQ